MSAFRHLPGELASTLAPLATTFLLGCLTPRYEADLLVRPSSTRADDGKDRLMAEKALDPRQTPLDLPAGPGRPTFEVQLTPVVGLRHR